MFKKFMLGVSTLSLMFAACTDPDDSSEIPMFPGMEKISDKSEAELYENYMMLDLFYLYAHTRNELSDNYKVYLHKGSNDNNGEKSFCSEELYDVCYMYDQMADPFTHYFDPLIAERILESVLETEEVIGIGAEAQVIQDETSKYLSVTQIYPNSPSEKAGLQEGDIIVSMDGLPITTVENFESMSTGNIGSTVEIVVKRGTEILSFTVTRAEYKEPSVTLHYEDSIPVIQIKQFSTTTSNDSGTYAEFVEILKKTATAKSTIIDLRGNPGGETEHCNAVSAELLSKGDTVIIDIESKVDSVKEGRQWKYYQSFDTITYTALEDGLAKDRYFVLLADTGSASCAEIVLESTAANKKSPIVGQLSYGKGIGQAVIQTEVSGGLALITALQGFDKNWESYHDLGIVPDFVINDPDEQMAAAVTLAKEATYLRTAGYGTQKLNHFSKERFKDPSNKIPTAKDLKLRYKMTR